MSDEEYPAAEFLKHAPEILAAYKYEMDTWVHHQKFRDRMEHDAW